MPTICLNMIVKNESKIITRLFDSVMDLIDTYCICDTGSTDNTIEIISEYFEEKNMQGVIFTEPFQNFGHNRNVALKRARDMADYTLFLDADMVLKSAKGFSKDELIHQAYMVKQGTDTFTYYNLRLVHRTVDVNCMGYTHEYYDINCESTRLETLHIDDVGDGGAKADKFERDIRLLKQSIDEGQNLARSYFYLGNSYKDSGKPTEAIGAYTSALKHQTWDEERFISRLNIGKCCSDTNRQDEAVASWLLAYQECPKRMESLYELIKHYRITSRHELCYLFYDKAVAIEYPKDKVLFINDDVYGHLLDYEITVFGYYLLSRHPEVIQRVFVGYRRLLGNDCFRDKSGILMNFRFYADHIFLESFGVSVRAHELGARHDGFFSSSPSIIKHGVAGYLVNLRLVNYRIDENGGYVFNNATDKVVTKNMALTLDKNFNVLEKKLFISSDSEHDKRVYGLEDVRLIEHAGVVRYTATYEDSSSSRLMISHGVYDARADTIETNLIEYKPDNPCEKNWVMFDNDGELNIIYQWHPLMVGRIDGNRLNIIRTVGTPDFFQHLRGSTNGIRMKDELWFITHLVTMCDGRRHYYHCLVALDAATLAVKKYSIPFMFSNNNNIEYCLGLLHDDDSIIMTYSLNDGCGKIIKIRKDKLCRRIWLN